MASRIELVFGADCQRAGIFHSSDEGVADAAASGEPGAPGMSTPVGGSNASAISYKTP